MNCFSENLARVLYYKAIANSVKRKDFDDGKNEKWWDLGDAKPSSRMLEQDNHVAEEGVDNRQ